MMRYSFGSGLSRHIIGLIEQKRADGFLYHAEESLLKRFDSFCMEFFPDAQTVTYELAASWSQARPHESGGYHNRRISILRILSLYILSIGEDAYIPNFFCKAYRPVHYIPSKEEVRALLHEMVANPSKNKRTHRMENECQIMFLLFYCCGLRLSEARLLRRENADTESGVLKILESKGKKNRLVYLPQDGIAIVSEYKSRIVSMFPDSPWMFPGISSDKPISSSGVEQCFLRYWNRLHIEESSHKRPTPHCLRHAFVVERFNEWALQGVDTNRMLPYLSKYLGHKNPDETFYYYHLAHKAFNIVRQKDTVAGRVIPEVVEYEE